MNPQAPISPSARILIIDDEPDLRTLYELTLLRQGYRVEAAGDLLQAREHLKAHRFDAVITDMRLPDGLGLELLRDLATQQRPERRMARLKTQWRRSRQARLITLPNRLTSSSSALLWRRPYKKHKT